MFDFILKTSIRNLLKNKLLTTINILGLAVGITCALVIYLVVSYETNFDKYHHNHTYIHRIYTKLKFGDRMTNITGIPYPMYDILKNEVPQVKEVAQVFKRRGSYKILDSEKNIKSQFYKGNDVVGVDASFFNILDWEWLQGNPEVSLSNIHSIVLAEKTALNLFGTRDVIGKELYLNRDFLLTVTGVIADPKGPTNFEFSGFVSYKLFEKEVQEYADWTSVGSSFETLVLLDTNEENQTQLKTDFLEKINQIYKSKIEASTIDWKLAVQPLNEVHFTESVSPMTGSIGSKIVLKVLIVIAIMITLIACINYINLSTAFASLRTKEIGIRKILGGSKKHLIAQFLGETFLLVSVALLFSFGLTEFFLMYVSEITGWVPQKQLLREALQNDINIYLFLPSIVLLITFLAGFYPALITTATSPLKAFKTTLVTQKIKGITIRRILVIFQFAICQLFIFGSIIVLQQLEFIQEKSLGFNKEHVMHISLNREDRDKAQILKNKLAHVTGISEISLSNLTPITNGWTMYDIVVEKDTTKKNYAAFTILADTDFFKVYEFDFLAGDLYPASDSMTHLVVNQAFLKWLGLEKPVEAVGKEVFFNNRSLTITGVVADFHISSLHSEIRPVMFGMSRIDFQTLNIKVNPLHTQKTIAEIEGIWKEVLPDTPLTYNFLEDTVYRMYQDETQMFKMFNLFAGLAVFISCLGLYGLVAFMSIYKTKEIGIRKVLGATVTQVVMLFSKEFILLVPLSLLIAGPLGYYFMDEWLSDFAYQIPIEFQYLLITLLITMLIALATVGLQSVKAASKNPVDALRSE